MRNSNSTIARQCCDKVVQSIDTSSFNNIEIKFSDNTTLYIDISWCNGDYELSYDNIKSNKTVAPKNYDGTINNSHRCC